MRKLLVTISLMVLVWTVAIGQLGKPDTSGNPIGVYATKVTPLAWSASDLRSEAAIVCSAAVICPSGSTITYSWSGLDFRGQASTQAVTGYAYSPGTYTVTCTVHVVYPTPPGGHYDGSASATCYAFGGPFTATLPRTKQKREGLTNPPSSRFQPWILEDYSGGTQDQSVLTVQAAGNQPGTATSYLWSKVGTIQFTAGTTGQITGVTAQGCCGRGGSFPIVTYTVTIDGQQYSSADSTDPEYKAISCHRPTYCRYDPDDTVTVDNPNPPPWLYINKYYLYIVSNIGDPLTLTEFQERYPGPHFTWEGSDYYGATPDLGIPPLASGEPGPQPPDDPVPVVDWNKPEGVYWIAGEADKTFDDSGSGYDYDSKAGPDAVGATWNIDVAFPGLVVYQDIWAATTDTNPSALGIFLKSYTLKMWATGVTRQ